MKKIYLLLSLLIICVSSLFAQAPEKFTYQAVVRNASNQLVINAQVGVRVNILQGSASGNAVYSESHVTSSNANGLITVNIGGGSVLHGSFEGIDWSDGPYFLKTDIDPNGGNDYSITSTQQLLSVPYALYAKEAGNGFSGDYNDLTNTPQIPTVPTNVSAFDNDAGYLTSYTEQQILTISNDTVFLTGGSFVKLPAGFDGDYNSLMNKPEPFSGDYNDLTNQPTIPTVPTNVSAFTNDAGYLTSFTEQQVLSLSHDTLFLTGGSFVKLPGGFDGDYNSLTNKPELFSGDYNDLTNKPTIPTVPTNVSAFTNDAGYITMDSIPTIPTVPTYVSAFTNDAGYLTSFTEQQVLSLSHDTLFLTGGSFVKLPESFDGDYNSLTNKPELFSGDYNDLTNQPTIPVVPTNVSVFTNDAGYLTSFTEQQVLSLSHDTLFLTGGSFVKLPAGFDGDYNSLMNKPTIPTVPTNISAFTNDAGYLTSYTETDPQFNAWDKDYNDLTNTPTIPTVPTNVSAFTNDAGYLTSFTEQQVLSLSHDTLFLTGGSFVKLPAGFDGDYNSLTNKPELFSGDYNDLENVPQIPQIPADVSVFNNDAGYITEASCNGMNICEMFNGLEALQSQVDSLQQSLLLPETQVLLPIVVTTVVSDSVASFPTYGGNVTSDGGSVVSAKGVCWNTTGSPTLTDNHTIDGGGVGAFLSDLRPLIRDTTYYVRAYATNSAGTSYGTQVSFTFHDYQCWDGTGLNPNDALPCQEGAMVTDQEGNIYYTVQVGSQCWMRENLRHASGNVHFYWPDVLQACPTGWHLPDNSEWEILGNYMNYCTTSSSQVNFGDGSYWTSTAMPWGSDTLIMAPTVQSYNIIYPVGYYVQYAGEDLSVRCLRDEPIMTVTPLTVTSPIVVTAAVSDIAASSATCGGDVTSDGGSVVSAKGVCWNTTGDPTISDNHTIDGGGMGAFESNMHGLSVNTTYYVRAYATNSAGTSYGNQVSFTSTVQFLPSTVMTAAVSYIAAASATCGGNVTSDGGSVVSAKGVCWNTTGNPTISDNHTIDGGGMGTFESNMHGLSTDTTYYVRAYATNSTGTSYGSQVSFTIVEYQTWDGSGLNPNDGLPCQGGAMVTDLVGNVYNTMQIGNQCWMRENLRDASGNEHIFWPDVLQVCPTGWHLPDNEDWGTLGNYLAFQGSNASSSLVTFGNGDYWTSSIESWVSIDGDISFYLHNPTVQSYSVVFSQTGWGLSDAGSLLSVRCVRDWSCHTIAPTPAVMTAVVSDIAATSVTCSSNVTSDGGSVVSAKGMCWNTTGLPTLSDNHTFAGGGVGTFESILHGLVVGSTYYVRAYATNSGGTSYSNQITFKFHGGYQTWDGTGLNPNDAFACQGAPTVADHEGNVYNTVQIGNQCWTRENMRCTTSPSTGTTILEYSADSTSYSYTGKKAYYVNGSADNTAIYGLLYNWNAAVDTFNTAFGETSTNTDYNNSVDVTFSGHRRGICPVGWHVPSDAEWFQLRDYVSSQSAYTCDGNPSNIAKALASNTWGWNYETDSCTIANDPSTNNATGFSVVPAGSIHSIYMFGGNASIWSATQFDISQAYDRWTGLGSSTINRCNTNPKCVDFSVRCLRD